MKRTFEYIRGYEKDLIEKDQQRNSMFDSLWNMAYSKWDFLEADKKKLTNVRSLVDTSPAEALRNASIALSNTVPHWEVAPYGTSLYELQRTERLENCLSWNFNKMNQRGVGTLLYDKMFSSLLYDMIVTRVDDLDFHFKDTGTMTPLQKHIRSQGRFVAQVFDPRSIHYESSMGTFTALVHTERVRALDVYNYWKTYENNHTPAGRRVSAALAKMDEKLNGKSRMELKSIMFQFYDFYSYDQVLRHGHFTSGNPGATTLSETTQDDIIFADEENELGFINWSIRQGGSRIENSPEYQVNPMLAPLYWGNSWETVNILRSLVMSEPIKRMLEQIKEIHITRDGKSLPVNEDGVASAFQGEDVKIPSYAPLDPNAPAIVQQLQSEIVKVTGANVLSDVTSAKTTPFATLNAMIQVAMSRLDINRRDGALSCADDALIMMRWADKLKKPLMSYRKQSRRLQSQGFTLQMQAGEQVTVDPRDYDLDFVDIGVDIKPRTPTDFQQQVLTAIQLNKQLKVPWQYVVERFVGIENAELLKNQWEDEQFSDAEIQAALQNIILQEQMRAQQQQQQPQANAPQANAPQANAPQANAPQAPGEPMAQSAFGQLGGGQGVNPAMMGQSPSAFAPGLTRESISGQTQGGEPIAAGG